MRLDKLLATKGFGSRKDVKKIVKDKRVSVNGTVVKDASLILDLDHDVITLDEKTITHKPFVYYLLNKPASYISSTQDEMYPSVLNLIDDTRKDLIIVGRLDVDTEGLLLITNDGQFSHQIAHGKKEVRKIYYVELEHPFDKKYIDELEKGITLDDGPIKPAYVHVISEKVITVSIAEGRYHQVKRMMHYCDNQLTYLKRTQIGSLKLDENLELGDYRELTDAERNTIII